MMPKVRRNDPENKLFIGCLTFGALSLVIFLLTFWPFVAFATYTMRGLTTALVLALVPTYALGPVCSKKLGLAGLGSFMAGILTFAVFFFLRHLLYLTAARNAQLPSVEYPEAFITIIPICSVLVAVALMLIFPPKQD